MWAMIWALGTLGAWPVGAEAQQAAGPDPQQQLADRYGADLAKVARTPSVADDVELGQKLLDAARGATDRRYQRALCRQAYELFIAGPAGYAKAVEAARMLMEIPAAAEQGREKLLAALELLTQTGSGTQRSRSRKVLARELIAMGDEHVAQGQIPEALEAYRRAGPHSSVLDSEGRQQLQQRLQVATTLRTAEVRAEKLRDELDREGRDRKTIHTLALLYLVELNRPRAARQWVDADYWDPLLRTYLPLAVRSVDDLPPETCLELARWYQTMLPQASRVGRAFLEARALRCYDRYLAGVRGPQPEDVRQARQRVADSVQALPDALKRVAGLLEEGPRAKQGLKPGFPRDNEQAVKAARAMMSSDTPLELRRQAFTWLTENVADYDGLRRLLIRRCAADWTEHEEKLQSLLFLGATYPQDAQVAELARRVALSALPVGLRAAALDILFTHHRKDEASLLVARRKLADENAHPTEQQKVLEFLAAMEPKNEGLAVRAGRWIHDQDVPAGLRQAALSYLLNHRAKAPGMLEALGRVTAQRFSSQVERMLALQGLLEMPWSDKLGQVLLAKLSHRWATEAERLLAIDVLKDHTDTPAVRTALREAADQAWRSKAEIDTIQRAIKADN
jgi:hypothetical protein